MMYDLTDAQMDWAQDTALLAVAGQECPACGYALGIHNPPGLDRNGGCPWDEVDAMRRWGLL